MNEITTTRHNPLIDPAMHVWGWEIPVYLFLGGMVAGMMIISGFFLLKGRHKEFKCSCHSIPVISILFLTLGMFALFLDLEHKLFVWRLYTTFKISSPMSWGSWILILVYPALILNILIKPGAWITNKLPWTEKLSAKINSNNKFILYIGSANLALGALLGIYTGVLLSTMGSRPLWNSASLWLLFLVSGLSTAAAFVHMIAKEKYERELLAKADNMFLTTELFVIVLLIIGLLSSSKAHIEAANLLISGPFAPVFWVFVLLLGIIIPLIIQLNAVTHRVKHTPIAPLMVIIGGLILRFVFVYAGQFSHYFNAHFK